jgi:hypothetical protein
LFNLGQAAGVVDHDQFRAAAALGEPFGSIKRNEQILFPPDDERGDLDVPKPSEETALWF